MKVLIDLQRMLPASSESRSAPICSQASCDSGGTSRACSVPPERAGSERAGSERAGSEQSEPDPNLEVRDEVFQEQNLLVQEQNLLVQEQNAVCTQFFIPSTLRLRISAKPSKKDINERWTNSIQMEHMLGVLSRSKIQNIPRTRERFSGNRITR